MPLSFSVLIPFSCWMMGQRARASVAAARTRSDRSGGKAGLLAMSLSMLFLAHLFVIKPPERADIGAPALLTSWPSGDSQKHVRHAAFCCGVKHSQLHRFAVGAVCVGIDGTIAGGWAHED